MLTLRCSRVILAACAACLLLWGCSRHHTTAPTDRTSVAPYPPASSPYNVLSKLRDTYVDRNLTEYLSLFSSDFFFAFNREFYSGGIDPDPNLLNWGIGHERTSADHMFNSVTMDSISLSFVQEPAIDSESEYPGTWKVHLTHVNLRVATRKADGRPWEIRVQDGAAVFYLKEYPLERASDGRPLWKIWRWEDDPGAVADPFPQGRSVDTTYWGMIKALYH